MGRIIGIDYGGKRCGMAWTDPLQISTNPLDTVSTDVLEDKIHQLIGMDHVSDIVIGLPTHADGKLTAIGKKVKELSASLKTRYLNIQIHHIDEAFTSKRASQLMVSLGTKKKKRRQKESIDQMSAVIILKDFLDRL